MKDKTSFGYDLEFLQNHLDSLIVLKSDDERAQIILSPQYQGRVMSSTSNGLEGLSYGWINYDLIRSGQTLKQFNPFGGEDRFWLGPEGGQYSIFFEGESSFDFENWQTPAGIDTEAYEVKEISDKKVLFSHPMTLKNYSGTTFELHIERGIELLSAEEIEEVLGIDISRSAVESVAFTSDNRLKNVGKATWTKEDGLLSIWILGMFKPSASTCIILPYNQDAEDSLPILNDSYFGKVPESRLKVEEDVIYFSGDGKYRSKIGLRPPRAKSVLGSYDAKNKVLTIVSYSLSADDQDYVNSMWEIQDEPYQGDAVNAYNDGPLEGSDEQMGPFYELESSSAAKSLAPGESIQHKHTTIHFRGTDETLDHLSREILGVGLDQVKAIFSRS